MNWSVVAGIVATILSFLGVYSPPRQSIPPTFIIENASLPPTTTPQQQLNEPNASSPENERQIVHATSLKISDFDEVVGIWTANLSDRNYSIEFQSDGSFVMIDDGVVTNYHDAKFGIVATTTGSWSIIASSSLEKAYWAAQHPYDPSIYVPTPQSSQLVVRLDLGLPSPTYSLISLAARPFILELGASSFRYVKK